MEKEEACICYAKAWNTLNPDILIDAMDWDIQYSSQMVLADMNGITMVAEYLRGKMETIGSDPEYKVFAELAETQPYPMYPAYPQPCVVISQGTPENLVGTVLFETSATGISKLCMCIIPPPETTKRSGVYAT